MQSTQSVPDLWKVLKVTYHYYSQMVQAREFQLCSPVTHTEAGCYMENDSK